MQLGGYTRTRRLRRRGGANIEHGGWHPIGRRFGEGIMTAGEPISSSGGVRTQHGEPHGVYRFS